MGFDADDPANGRLDLAAAAEFSPGAISILRSREEEGKVEPKTDPLADHTSGKKEAQLAAPNDGLKWECVLVMATSGRVWIEKKTLIKLPELKQNGMILFVEENRQIFYFGRCVRTMELHPV